MAVGQTRRYQPGADLRRAREPGSVLVDARRDVEPDVVARERRVGEVTETVRAHACGAPEVVGPIGRGDRVPRGGSGAGCCRDPPRAPGPGTRSSPSDRSLDLSKTPWLFGSGHPVMPWERMQRAKANAEASVPFCVVVVAPVVAAVVEEATLATPAEPPPPQPAASSANAATRTTEARMSGLRQRTMFGSLRS